MSGYLESFLDTNLSEVPKIQPVPGATYEVEIKSAFVQPSRNQDLPSDAKNIAIFMRVVDEVTDTLRHYLPLPNSDDDSEARIKKFNRLRDAMDAFSLEHDFEVEDEDDQGARKIIGWEGARATAVLRVRKDDEYGDSNEVVKWINS